jgi:hypothetical protein
MEESIVMSMHVKSYTSAINANSHKADIERAAPYL